MLLTRNQRPAIKFTVLLLLAAMALLLVSPATAKNNQSNVVIAPPDSSPYGHTYGEWAAKWWQWALTTPPSVNPVVDTTGRFCSQNQSGDVWFLAGTFGGSATRTCTVHKDKALFFPLLNSAWFAYLSDAPETRTEEFVRAQTECSVPTDLEVTIDDVAVSNPLQYHAASPLFDVQLSKKNLFGLTEAAAPQLLLSPSVDQGYYLFLAPLSRGTHTISWSGSWSCVYGDSSQDVTYNLIVK